MSMQWTVIRFVPDVIADERLNVGVAVIDGRRVRTRFIRNMTRLSHFADASSVDAYTVWLQEIGDGLTADDVQWHAENGNGIIQFDSIQPTMMRDSSLLLDRLTARYLRDNAVPKK